MRKILSGIMAVSISYNALAQDENLRTIRFLGQPENVRVTISDKLDDSYQKHCITPCLLEVDMARPLEFLGEKAGYKDSKESGAFASDSLNFTLHGYLQQKIPGIKLTLYPKKKATPSPSLESEDNFQSSSCASLKDVTPRPIKYAYPKMPNGVRKSGYCKMEYNIAPNGKPTDIEAVECSNKVFERNSIKTIKKLRYAPPNIDGRNYLCGLEFKVHYQYNG